MSNEVVMIAQDCRDPRVKSIDARVEKESIPEDLLRLLGRKGVKAIAHFSGHEVNRVVAIPVFEFVFTVV